MIPSSLSTRTAFVVLGMHRSGTSSIAGSLVTFGASAPSTLMQPSPDNPLGFWESDRVMHLNDELLATRTSNWRDWGAFGKRALVGPTSDHFAGPAKALLETEFGEARAIVLKDPRICRIYPFWRDALLAADLRPVVVLPMRKPIDVARSLNLRNGLSVSLGLRLWLRHALDAEFSSRADLRQISTLDEYIAQWPVKFATLATISGFDLALSDTEKLEEAGRFWTRIPNAVASALDTKVPDLIDRAWAIFNQMSTEGDTETLRLRLDQIREEFETASDLCYDCTILP
jgi:hypothetical protein